MFEKKKYALIINLCFINVRAYLRLNFTFRIPLLGNKRISKKIVRYRWYKVLLQMFLHFTILYISVSLILYIYVFPSALWWLILWMNLTGKLSIILHVSVRLFLDGINIWICRLSKADCLPQYGWATYNPLKAWMEWKSWVRDDLFSLPDRLLAGTEFYFFKIKLRIERTPSALLAVHLAEYRSWNFASIMHAPTPYHKCLYRYLYIYIYTKKLYIYILIHINI